MIKKILFTISLLFIPISVYAFTTPTAFYCYNCRTNVVGQKVLVLGNQFTAAGPTGIIDMSEGGVITLGSGVKSATATLGSSYDTTRSSLFFDGIDQDTTTNTASSSQASIYLTNSTTVTCTRGSASTTVILKCSYHIVQWSTGVTKSVQRGEIFTQNAITSNTDTITSVDTTKSFANMLGSNSTSTAAMRQTQFTTSLTNGTTVTATRQLSTDGATSTYQVTEFNTGYTNSVQEISVTTSSAFSNTGTVSPAVTTTESMLFWGGTNSNGGAVTNMLSTCELTNGTTITMRKGISANSNTAICTVVDFNSTYLNSNTQSGNIVINAALTGTATISSISTTKSLLSWGGVATDNANLNRAFMYIGLTNATTVTGTKGSNAASTATSTFTVLESK